MVQIAVDTLPVGGATRVTAEGRDQSGASVTISDVSWSSSAPLVATVSAVGIVTATGLGLTTIVASASGQQGSVIARVVATPVAGVVVTPSTLVLLPGASTQLSAVALDAAGRSLSGRPIAWLSSDPARVTVSETGMVTALVPGLVSVSAISGAVYASAEVRVSGPPGPVATVALNPPAASRVIGQSLQLLATLEDAIGNVATDRPVTWSSSAPAVATVSAAGLVTTHAKGSALIEAVSEGKRGTSTITVSDPLDAIKIGVPIPVENDIVGDTLAVTAFASGRNPIVRAQAKAANKETALVYMLNPSGKAYAWMGTLDLSDVYFGPYQLIVSVVDAQGNVGTLTVPFKRGVREGKGGTTLPPRSK